MKTDISLSANATLKSRGQLWRDIKRNKIVYLCISPFFILFAIFGVYPIVYSFILSFQQWDGLGDKTFIGLDNYRFLISDPLFWKSITNTITIWIMSTIPQLVLALILAFMLNSAFLRFKTGYRILYFLPNVTSTVAVAIVFGTMFGESYGFLNFILNQMGIEGISWISSPFWVKVSIAGMIIWRWTGYNAIVYLAGLQGIPTDVYEAARIDGATTFQSLTRITIPLLRPIIMFTVITSTIGGLQIFSEAQVLTDNSGGVGNGALTIVLYLYQTTFTNHLFGYGSAIAWGMFVIILLFSIFNMKLMQTSEKK